MGHFSYGMAFIILCILSLVVAFLSTLPSSLYQAFTSSFSFNFNCFSGTASAYNLALLVSLTANTIVTWARRCDLKMSIRYCGLNILIGADGLVSDIQPPAR
jgi:hypothetical protein